MISKIKKIVVLISGQGSNLQAIIDACASNELSAQVVAVISNKTAAKGLERAQKFAIPTVVKEKTPDQTRVEYDQELAELVASYQPDLIVLAGWMRVLSNAFLKNFPDKAINLHPALPGAFPGANAIERAFNAFRLGEIQETGVIVHLVPDEGIDSGPVLGQTIVPIYQQDTLATLTTRMHETEHSLLISVLKNFLF